MSHSCALPALERYDAGYYIYFTEQLYPPSQCDREAEFVAHHLELSKRSFLLDMPCGYGRLTNRLAPRTAFSIGVDCSEGNLKIARQRAKKQHIQNVAYINYDMRSFSASEIFDAVLVAFTSFGMFSDHHNRKVLKGLRHSIKRGGRLCIDVLNTAFFSNLLPRENSFQKDDLLMSDALSWTPNGRLRSIRTYRSAEKTHTSRIEIATFSLPQIRDLLQSNQFHILETYSDFLGTRSSSLSDKFVIIAERCDP